MDTSLTRIPTTPADYDVQTRVYAAAVANGLGQGLRMELHSSMTYYFADPMTPVGQVEVYAPKTYTGHPEYVTTLNSPFEEWSP